MSKENEKKCFYCGTLPINNTTTEGLYVCSCYNLHNNNGVVEQHYKQTPVRELCKKYGLTQKALANKFDVPVRTVEDWSSGRHRCPSYFYKAMIRIFELEAKLNE